VLNRLLLKDFERLRRKESVLTTLLWSICSMPFAYLFTCSISNWMFCSSFCWFVNIWFNVLLCSSIVNLMIRDCSGINWYLLLYFSLNWVILLKMNPKSIFSALSNSTLAIWLAVLLSPRRVLLLDLSLFSIVSKIFWRFWLISWRYGKVACVNCRQLWYFLDFWFSDGFDYRVET